jgi:hypothetical protein
VAEGWPEWPVRVETLGGRWGTSGGSRDMWSRRQATGSGSYAALYQSSGTGQRGAGAGCLWRLSDDEHSGAGAVKRWRRKKKGCCTVVCSLYSRRRQWKVAAQAAGTVGGNSDSEAVGTGKAAAATVRRRLARPGRLYSDWVTDRWVPRGFQFFSIYPKLAQL